MPRTITEIRRADRERKRQQRAAAAASGIPSPNQVNIAIVEAVSFAASDGVNIAAAKAGSEPSITMAAVLSAAHNVRHQRP